MNFIFIIIDKDGRKRKASNVICKNCGKEFLKPERFLESKPNHCCSFKCSSDLHRKTKVAVNCGYCGKEKLVSENDYNKSKTKFFFCNREHQSAAQFHLNGIDYSCNFKNGIHTYRKIAFRIYPPECEICKYQEDPRILEVHHIDKDRNNGDPKNLIILCPICHAKITRGFYVLENRLLKSIQEVKLHVNFNRQG